MVVRRLNGVGKTTVSRSFTHGWRSDGLFIPSWAWWTAFLGSLLVHRRYTVHISSMISQHRQPLQTTNARASFKLIFCDHTRQTKLQERHRWEGLCTLDSRADPSTSTTFPWLLLETGWRRPPQMIKQNETAVGRLIHQNGQMGFSRDEVAGKGSGSSITVCG
jgi:hypothetical protein